MAKLTREPIPFTQIANDVLNNKELSMKAKGMYAYLFSKPDNWNFSSKRIKDDFSDGITAILSALKELEENGLLMRLKQSSGRVDYVLTYSQNWETPFRLRAKAKIGKPQEGKTDTISNKELLNNKENNNKELFSWEKSRDKMMEKEGSDMDIIATFLEAKKISPKTPEELTGYIKRYRKVAQDIKPFVGVQFAKFWKAIEMCKEESYRVGYDWGLETIYKKITKI